MDQPPAITDLTAAELGRRLAAGSLSAVDLASTCLERIAALDGAIGAFLGVDPETVLAQARASDARRAAGAARGPLDGIPVARKDLIAAAGEPLTCASRMLENFISPYDATVTARLRAAGAVLCGRLNMDEFAMGSTTENSAFQRTRNPWDHSRVPGGSSGGSAAAVAAREVPLALGTDTGGSIRQPAAFCGVTGIKPTYGRVSRYGVVAFASSLDQVGPIARSVEDCALLLEAIAGADPHDATSARQPVPAFASALNAPPRPWRIGLPRQYASAGLDPAISQARAAAAEFYRAAGCELVEVDLPHTDLAVPVYYIIATAEASANLARFDGVRYGHRSTRATDAVDLYTTSRGEGFGAEVKRRIILGTYVLSSGYYDAWYRQAQKVRGLIQRDFLRAFATVDFLLAPVTPAPAWRFGAMTDDPLALYLADIFTISVNLAGLPALSLPAGFNDTGLPVGLQLIGRPFDETTILQAGHAFEQAHGFARRKPGDGSAPATACPE
jgi:aspartyl-tRNA(Asn)/glutamyl-tRNA(Gln) amidotransferase subunit A